MSKYLFDSTWDDIRLKGINHELYCRRFGTWQAGNHTAYLLGSKTFVNESDEQFTAFVVDEVNEGVIPISLQSKLYTLEEMETNGYTLYVAPVEE
jgi:hypothetical protein